MKKVLEVAFLVSIVLNAFLGVVLYTQYVENENIKAINKELAEKISELSTENINLKKEIEVLKQENFLLKNSLESILRTISNQTSLSQNLEGNYDWAYIVAVHMVPKGFFDYEIEGIVMKVYVSVIPGEGRVFIATSPRIGKDLQESASTALKVAMNYTNSTIRYDSYIVIKADREINVVDGPSAGGVLTILMIARILGIETRKDVCMTGTILPDGSIGPVGGVLEKAKAAAARGIKIFLVPKGQGKILEPVIVSKKIGSGITITFIKGYKEVPLEEALRREGYNITIYEVGSIQEALKYFLVSD